MPERLRFFRFFICIFLLIVIVHENTVAQNTKVSKEQKSVIVHSISDLIYASKYTEAHDTIVQNLLRHNGDVPLTYVLYIMLSDIERLTGNKENALKYTQKSKEILLSGDPDYANQKMNTVYHQMANLYFENNQFDSAYVYAQSSLLVCEKYSPDQYIECQGYNLPIIGYHYFLEGKYKEAEDAYKRATEINNQSNAPCENPLIYLKLGEIFAKKNQYYESVAILDKAYAIADSCNNTQYKLAVTNKVIDIHLQFKNFEEAAKSLQLKMKLMEEIQLYDQKNKLQELETKFKTQLKDEENRSLKIINQDQEKQNSFQTVILVLSGFIIAIVLIFAILFFYQKRNISRQKEAVERLNLLNQKIFSVISHDFKGPMMGIDMLLEMNEKYGMTAETFANQTGQLKNDIKQASLIMENLMNWSKTELGLSHFETKVSKVRNISEEVTVQLQSLIQQKKIEVSNEILPENELNVPPDILKIIFRNLLSNAIKYSYEHGKILLSYNPLEKTYTVNDAGTGIDPERLKQLFRNKLDSKLGTFHEIGYGIGLNIVYELVHKYNGSIWVVSTPGEGTSVHFKFT
jgi:signal transduction histidine kinase